MSGPVRLSPQEMDRLSRLAVELAHNDKTRAHFANLVRVVDPSSAKAFTDVYVTQQLAAFKKGMEDERLREKMERVAETKDANKKKIIKERGYDAKQVAAIDSLLTEYGMSDFEAAADIYAHRNPVDIPDMQPPPEMIGGPAWDFPTVPGPDGKMLAFDAYIKDPRKYSNVTAYNMITEFKRAKLPRGFHAR